MEDGGQNLKDVTRRRGKNRCLWFSEPEGSLGGGAWPALTMVLGMLANILDSGGAPPSSLHEPAHQRAPPPPQPQLQETISKGHWLLERMAGGGAGEGGELPTK